MSRGLLGIGFTGMRSGVGGAFASSIPVELFPTTTISFRSEIFRQARVAFDEAAAIIMVIDGRAEVAGPDLELVRLLRKTGRPIFLAVNKADSEKQVGSNTGGPVARETYLVRLRIAFWLP